MSFAASHAVKRIALFHEILSFELMNKIKYIVINKSLKIKRITFMWWHKIATLCWVITQHSTTY